MSLIIDKNTIRCDYAVVTFKDSVDSPGVTVCELLEAIAEFVEQNPDHFAVGTIDEIQEALGFISNAFMPGVDTQDLEGNDDADPAK